jgi:hypothetical protein
MDGAQAGSLSVESSSGAECARTSADAKMSSPLRLNTTTMALATDSKVLGSAAAKSNRRSPSPQERTQLLALAAAAYRKQGVASSVLTKLQTISVTATDLDHDGRPELIGSFVASKRTRPQGKYVAFVIAEWKGGRYAESFSLVDKITAKDIMAGATLSAVNDGIRVEKLIDHLNLDGEGWDEVITIKAGFEGDAYRIYKRQNSKWSSVYEFYNYRCAF